MPHTAYSQNQKQSPLLWTGHEPGHIGSGFVRPLPTPTHATIHFPSDRSPLCNHQSENLRPRHYQRTPVRSYIGRANNSDGQNHIACSCPHLRLHRELAQSVIPSQSDPHHLHRELSQSPIPSPTDPMALVQPLAAVAGAGTNSSFGHASAQSLIVANRRLS